MLASAQYCNQKSNFLLASSGTATTSSPSNTKFHLRFFNICENRKKLF